MPGQFTTPVRGVTDIDAIQVARITAEMPE
jgi:hypothetical protein